MEALDGVWIRQPFLADDLDRHDSVHELVAGLEDLPHAALAKPIEQQVRPQHQLGSMPLEQLIGLIRSDPTAFHQFAGHGARIGIAPFMARLIFSNWAASRMRYSRRASTKLTAEMMAICQLPIETRRRSRVEDDGEL